MRQSKRVLPGAAPHLDGQILDSVTGLPIHGSEVSIQTVRGEEIESIAAAEGTFSFPVSKRSLWVFARAAGSTTRKPYSDKSTKTSRSSGACGRISS